MSPCEVSKTPIRGASLLVYRLLVELTSVFFFVTDLCTAKSVDAHEGNECQIFHGFSPSFKINRRVDIWVGEKLQKSFQKNR